MIQLNDDCQLNIFFFLEFKEMFRMFLLCKDNYKSKMYNSDVFWRQIIYTRLTENIIYSLHNVTLKWDTTAFSVQAFYEKDRKLKNIVRTYAKTRIKK